MRAGNTRRQRDQVCQKARRWHGVLLKSIAEFANRIRRALRQGVARRRSGLQRSIREMKQNGVELYAPVADDQKGALIELELRDGVEHWVGLENFYAITRYNHSALYAMAVVQLSEAILEAYRSSP